MEYYWAVTKTEIMLSAGKWWNWRFSCWWDKRSSERQISHAFAHMGIQILKNVRHGTVVHTCNPSHVASHRKEDHSPRLVLDKNIEILPEHSSSSRASPTKFKVLSSNPSTVKIIWHDGKRGIVWGRKPWGWVKGKEECDGVMMIEVYYMYICTWQ
jgi:hypothetical protein